MMHDGIARRHRSPSDQDGVDDRSRGCLPPRFCLVPVGTWRLDTGRPGRILGALLVWAGLGCALSPGHAQTAQSQPYYVAGEIHCPDGRSVPFQPAGDKPAPMALNLACNFYPAAAAVSPAPLSPSGDLKGLMGAPLGSQSNDVLRCPDGSTRPFAGGSRSDLTDKIMCSEPANVAAERHRRVALAVERKQLEGRLRGDEGVLAALKASWQTGSPAYLLGTPWFWLIGIGLGVLLAARLFGSKR